MTGVSRKAQREKTRARLLEAAIRLFSAQGLSATKATDIARAAEVSVGTLYLHYGDKAGLLRAVLMDTVAIVADQLDSLWARRLRGDQVCSAELAAGLVNVVESQLDRIELCLSPEVVATDVGQQFVDAIMAEQQRRIEQAQSAGLARDDLDAAAAARALVGSFVAVIGWWVTNPAACHRAEVARVIAAMFDALSPGEIERSA